jgi:hypothetical protein
MCCSSQSFPGVKLAKTSLIVGFIFANLVQLAIAEPASSATVPASPEGLGITIFWVGAAIFACVAVAGGVILARKLHQQKALVAAGAVPAPEPQRQFTLPTNGHKSKTLKLNGKPAKAKILNNGNGNNSKRRRMFNYHKFYTEMVLQGPAPTSMAESAYNPYNGYNGYYVEYEQPRINNHNGNGHSNNGNGNGNGNGHENHAAESSNAVHADLIATQKSLIEEQQRLIHEQARLIQEKSQLIAEKNQLLDRQTQMLDNNLL